jgi:integrase
MSLKEVQKLWKALDKLPDKTYSLICRLLWDGAARLEDIFNMFWENITYGRGHDAEVTVPAGKTKSGAFYLPKETVSALKAFGGKNKRGPVFTRWHPVDMERKDKDKKVNSMMKQLHNTVKNKTKFVHFRSHDLRTSRLCHMVDPKGENMSI